MQQYEEYAKQRINIPKSCATLLQFGNMEHLATEIVLAVCSFFSIVIERGIEPSDVVVVVCCC